MAMVLTATATPVPTSAAITEEIEDLALLDKMLTLVALTHDSLVKKNNEKSNASLYLPSS